MRVSLKKKTCYTERRSSALEQLRDPSADTRRGVVQDRSNQNFVKIIENPIAFAKKKKGSLRPFTRTATASIFFTRSKRPRTTPTRRQKRRYAGRTLGVRDLSSRWSIAVVRPVQTNRRSRPTLNTTCMVRDRSRRNGEMETFEVAQKGKRVFAGFFLTSSGRKPRTHNGRPPYAKHSTKYEFQSSICDGPPSNNRTRRWRRSGRRFIVVDDGRPCVGSSSRKTKRRDHRRRRRHRETTTTETMTEKNHDVTQSAKHVPKVVRVASQITWWECYPRYVYARQLFDDDGGRCPLSLPRYQSRVCLPQITRFVWFALSVALPCNCFARAPPRPNLPTRFVEHCSPAVPCRFFCRFPVRRPDARGAMTTSDELRDVRLVQKFNLEVSAQSRDRRCGVFFPGF